MDSCPYTRNLIQTLFKPESFAEAREWMANYTGVANEAILEDLQMLSLCLQKMKEEVDKDVFLAALSVKTGVPVSSR